MIEEKDVEQILRREVVYWYGKMVQAQKLWKDRPTKITKRSLENAKILYCQAHHDWQKAVEDLEDPDSGKAVQSG